MPGHYRLAEVLLAQGNLADAKNEIDNILKNDEIIQCDSCNRILFFVPVTPAAVEQPAS